MLKYAKDKLEKIGMDMLDNVEIVEVAKKEPNEWGFVADLVPIERTGPLEHDAEGNQDPSASSGDFTGEKNDASEGSYVPRVHNYPVEASNDAHWNRGEHQESRAGQYLFREESLPDASGLFMGTPVASELSEYFSGLVPRKDQSHEGFLSNSSPNDIVSFSGVLENRFDHMENSALPIEVEPMTNDLAAVEESTLVDLEFEEDHPSDDHQIESLTLSNRNSEVNGHSNDVNSEPYGKANNGDTFLNQNETSNTPGLNSSIRNAIGKGFARFTELRGVLTSARFIDYDSTESEGQRLKPNLYANEEYNGDINPEDSNSFPEAYFSADINEGDDSKSIQNGIHTSESHANEVDSTPLHPQLEERTLENQSEKFIQHLNAEGSQDIFSSAGMRPNLELGLPNSFHESAAIDKSEPVFFEREEKHDDEAINSDQTHCSSVDFDLSKSAFNGEIDDQKMPSNSLCSNGHSQGSRSDCLVPSLLSRIKELENQLEEQRKLTLQSRDEVRELLEKVDRLRTEEEDRYIALKAHSESLAKHNLELKKRVLTEDQHHVLQLCLESLLERLQDSLGSEILSESIIANLFASPENRASVNLSTIQQALISTLEQELSHERMLKDDIVKNSSTTCDELPTNLRASCCVDVPDRAPIEVIREHFDIVNENFLAVQKELQLKRPMRSYRTVSRYFIELEKAFERELENISAKGINENGRIDVALRPHLKSIASFTKTCASEMSGMHDIIENLEERIYELSSSYLLELNAKQGSQAPTSDTQVSMHHNDSVSYGGTDQTMDLVGNVAVDSLVDDDAHESLSNELNEVAEVKPQSEPTSSIAMSPYVDKALAASLVVSMILYRYHPGCMEVVASVLDFTDEQRVQVGLKSPTDQGLISNFLPGWSREYTKAMATNWKERSFSNLFREVVEEDIKRDGVNM